MTRVALPLLLASALSALAASETQRSSTAPTLMYEEPKLLTGSIYEKKSDRTRPLFTFKRTSTRSGSRLTVAREYSYPDGKPAARESVVYEGNNLVSFQIDQMQDGSSGSATLTRPPTGSGNLLFKYAVKGKEAKSADETLQPVTLIDDMVGPFLASRWDALAKGQKVKCRYIVVHRKETVGFTFVKDSETSLQGKPTMIVKMEPTSLIIAALVDPLFFTLERDAPHHILEYVGRTTPKVGDGRKWNDLDAITVFHWK